jgi:predicted amidophosphoribosyltransferase
MFAALAELFGMVLDVLTWPLLLWDRNKRLRRQLKRSEERCLHCGKRFPKDVTKCPHCGWTFEVEPGA